MSKRILDEAGYKGSEKSPRERRWPERAQKFFPTDRPRDQPRARPDVATVGAVGMILRREIRDTLEGSSFNRVPERAGGWPAAFRSSP